MSDRTIRPTGELTASQLEELKKQEIAQLRKFAKEEPRKEITAIQLNKLAKEAKELFYTSFTNDTFQVTDASDGKKLTISQCQVDRPIEFALVEEKDDKTYPKAFRAESGLIKSKRSSPSDKKTKYLVPITVSEGDELISLATYVHESIKESVVHKDNLRTAQILDCAGWGKADLDVKAGEKFVPNIITQAKDKEKNIVAGKYVMFFNMFKYHSPKAASRNTVIWSLGKEPKQIDPETLIGVPFEFIPCIRPLFNKGAGTTVSMYVVSMIITKISSGPTCCSQMESLKLLSEGRNDEEIEDLNAKLASLVSRQCAPKAEPSAKPEAQPSNDGDSEDQSPTPPSSPSISDVAYAKAAAMFNTSVNTSNI